MFMMAEYSLNNTEVHITIPSIGAHKVLVPNKFMLKRNMIDVVGFIEWFKGSQESDTE